jgi:chromosome segregation ATPase
MSVKVARELEPETETTETKTFNDDFPALEEKIYRAIELLKSAREGKAAAERDAQRLRDQLEQREEELDVLRGEMVSLRKEREEVRARVEKMLKQIDALVAEA